MVLFPESQRRAQQQIDNVVGRDRIPKIEDCEHLPYITAMVSDFATIGFATRILECPDRSCCL